MPTWSKGVVLKWCRVRKQSSTPMATLVDCIHVHVEVTLVTKVTYTERQKKLITSSERRSLKSTAL